MLIRIDNVTEATTRTGVRQILFYEVWEPSRPANLTRVFKQVGQWVVGQPYENFFEQSPPKVTTPAVSLQWGENGPIIALPALKGVLPRWHVAVRIRSYTKELHKKPSHPLAFPVIQYYTDTTIYVDDLLQSSFHVDGRCHSETKWLGKVIEHQQFHCTVQNPCLSVIAGSDTPGVYWQNSLRYIWEQYVKAERALPGYMLTGSPLTIPLDGSPMVLAPVNDSTKFESYAGIPAQSAWRLRPDVLVASEEWYEMAFKQVLTVKGRTVDQFLEFAAKFIKGKATVEESDKYKVCLVKALTIFQTTHPYVGDYRYTDKWKQQPADAKVVQLGATLGDCEDTAIGTFFLSVELLRSNWDSPLVHAMQQLLKVMGVPVGVSGRGRDPNCRLSGTDNSDELGVCHMYTVIVPFPILVHALTGSPPTNEQYKHLELPRSLFEEHLQVAVMETTIMATAFYHGREQEHHKEEWRAKIKECILEVKDNPLMWMNYTTPHPLSFESKDPIGELVHTRAYRLFTTALKYFLPSTYLQDLDIVKQGSFIARKVPGKYDSMACCDLCHKQWLSCGCGSGPIGVNTEALFESLTTLDQMKWRLTPNHEVTDIVYQKECEALIAFERPPVTMTVSGYLHQGVVADPCQCELLVTSMDERKHLRHLFPDTLCVDEDKGSRIMVFAWRLIPVETAQLMLKIQQEIGARKVTMTPYGNGYAFVFHFTPH